MSTATAVMMPTATVGVGLSLETWRCRSCRRIIARLEYDGSRVIEARCKCNCDNRLPDHTDFVRLEFPRR